MGVLIRCSKKELLPSSAGYGAAKYAIDLLVALVTFENSDIGYEALDILGFRGLREADFHSALTQRTLNEAEKEWILRLCDQPLIEQSDEIKFVYKLVAGI